MIIPAQPPTIANRIENVGPTVAIDIVHLCYLSALRAIKPAIPISQTEHFVKSTRELMELHIRGRILQRIINDIDVSKPGRRRQSAIRQKLKRSSFERDSLWNRNRHHSVIAVFLGRHLFGAVGTENQTQSKQRKEN